MGGEKRGIKADSGTRREIASPQLRRTTRKPVGLDMPSYKCLCEVLCSDFPRGVEAFLSHLQKAEVWQNGSYSPSRPTGGGLRAQALLLALPPVCQTGLRQLVCAFTSIRATGMWHMYTRAQACTRAHTVTGVALHSFL